MTDRAAVREPVGYHHWHSDMALSEVFADAFSANHPFVYRQRNYWLAAIPEQNGRIALVTVDENGGTRCLTPAPFSIRSRVNEYGGKCFTVCGHWFVFNNYQDNRIYAHNMDDWSPPQRLDEGDELAGSAGFADLIAPTDALILAVHEQVSADHRSSLQLVAIPFVAASGRAVQSAAPFQVVDADADFYACPTLAADGRHLAWVQWQHPDMPWDQSQLVVAEFHYDGARVAISGKTTVVDKADTAVCQAGFLRDGRLLFAADSAACNHWNLFIHDTTGTRQLTATDGEFGSPHWVFGDAQWQQWTPDSVLAVLTRGVVDELVEVNLATGAVTALAQPGPTIAQLRASGDQQEAEQVLLVAREKRDRATIRGYTAAKNTTLIYHKDGAHYHRQLSEPRHFSYPAADGTEVYGVYYAPFNTRYQPPSLPPPLLVMAHGGPTGRTATHYDGLKQYFCSMGFALFDANYRGSSGYGRKYRQALLGNWGLTDVDDIIAGIRFLAAEGRANPQQVFIRGSSAGGFTVLSALTRYPEMFAAGASYYGIGNLVTLANITHNFESRYTDRLVGETFDPKSPPPPHSRYVQRSPLHHFDRLQSPVILFQGREDRVVPPQLAREVARALAARGITHDYVEFPDEGHGFRNPENRLTALQKEIAFYRQVQARNPDPNGYDS